MRGAFDPAGARLLAVVATVGLTLAAGVGARGGPLPDLQQQAAGLRAAEHAALLELYGLDSRIEAAGAELAQIQSRLAAIGREQAAARVQLRVARDTLALSERRLGRTLVALYEDQTDEPLAVILAAKSFSEAVDGVDNLTRIASSHAQIAAQARAARRGIAAVSRSLREQAAETRRLEAAAGRRARELAQARAERSAYLDWVRAESATVAERIAAVEAQARAAQARAETVAAQASAAGSTAGFGAAPQQEAPEPAPAPTPEPAPVPAPAEPAPVQAPASGARTLVVTATAYSMKGTTSTGIPVGFGVVAVDPTVIPLGTRMSIPGYGEGVAADTGPGVQGAWIDVWLPTQAQAEAWGTKTLTIALH